MAVDITRSLLIAELDQRGWQYETFGREDRYLRIRHPDGRHTILYGGTPMQTSAVGRQICQYKYHTLDFATKCGYTVPPFLVTEDIAAAAGFLQQHGTIVVKPVNGAQTRGVSVGITTEDGLRSAIDHALAFSNNGTQRVILQKHVTGKLYRLLALDGKLIAAGLRTAAMVQGDGHHTVLQLIELANQDPRRSADRETPLKTINIEYARQFLGEERLQSVPAEGERVKVSAIDSVSAGGEAANVTDEVHADWRQVTEHLSRELGLFIAGFDVICNDISQPMADNYLPLLEINTDPGYKLHEYPTRGEPVRIAPLFLDAIFR